MNHGKNVLKQLEKITQRGHSHYEVFEDWLDLMITALMRDDDEYLKIVAKYKDEREVEKRNIDFFSNAFGELMIEMRKTNKEILGEIYQDWNLKNKNKGQYFTPPQIAKLMAKLTCLKGNVLDPACGSGVMLVAACKNMKYEDLKKSHFVGQDIDGTCVKMCALNLTFFNLNGFAIQGDSLAMEANWGYKTVRTIYGGHILKMTEEELERMKPQIKKAMRQSQMNL